MELMFGNSQATISPEEAPDSTEGKLSSYREVTPIARMLRTLRGQRTLRQVEADTGISNAYLSNLESGSKKPGAKTLAKLAGYYRVPIQDLLQLAGLAFDDRASNRAESVMDVQRSYDFVLADPSLSVFQKPNEAPSTDVQRFVVRMYEHYTGKRIL